MARRRGAGAYPTIADFGYRERGPTSRPPARSSSTSADLALDDGARCTRDESAPKLEAVGQPLLLHLVATLRRVPDAP